MTHSYLALRIHFLFFLQGEPVSLSDLEMLKGSKGERGLVGMPGACCGRMGPRSNLRADGSVLVPLPGPQGVKGEKGGEGKEIFVQN